MRFATWVSFMAFIAIGFCVSRRRNATKSSKCLLKKWIGSHKNAVSHTKKRSFQVPLLPQRVRIFEFLSDCSSWKFNKRNLVINQRFCYKYVAILNFRDSEYLNLSNLNKLRFWWTLCYFQNWEGRGVTPRWLTERRAI